MIITSLANKSSTGGGLELDWDKSSLYALYSGITEEQNLAFGQYREDTIQGVGEILYRYADSKGSSIDESIREVSTFKDLASNLDYRLMIIHNSDIYALITANEYATSIWKQYNPIPNYCVYENGVFNYGVTMTSTGSVTSDDSGITITWNASSSECDLVAGDIVLNDYPVLFSGITVVYTSGSIVAQKWVESSFSVGDQTKTVSSASSEGSATYSGTISYTPFSTYHNFTTYIWRWVGSGGYYYYSRSVQYRGYGTVVISSITFNA